MAEKFRTNANTVGLTTQEHQQQCKIFSKYFPPVTSGVCRCEISTQNSVSILLETLPSCLLRVWAGLTIMLVTFASYEVRSQWLKVGA